MNEQREKTIKALRSLPRKISSPVEFANMALEVLPHVPPLELPRLYRSLRDRKTQATVALPPVFIKNGILAAGFDGDRFEIYGGAIDETGILYAEEAQDYAEAGWGSDLAEHVFAEIAVVYLQDPATLAIERVAFAGLTRPVSEIRGDESKPLSELFNDAISLITGDNLVLKEMIATASFYTTVLFHCARCGCPFEDSISCDGCGSRFQYDAGDILWEKESFGCALPLKLERFFDEGHYEPYFSTAPFTQRMKERTAWLKSKQGREEAED